MNEIIKNITETTHSIFQAKINDFGRYSWINLLNQPQEFYDNDELSESILELLISTYRNKTDKWLCLEQHEIIPPEKFTENGYYSIIERLLKKYNQWDKFQIIDGDISKHDTLSYKRKLPYYKPLPLQVGEYHKFLIEENSQQLIFDKFDKEKTQVDTLFISLLGRDKGVRRDIYSFLKRNGFLQRGFVGFEPSNSLHPFHRKIDSKIDFPFNVNINNWDWREVSGISNLYLRTFLNVVSETKNDDNYMHITEKIDKSLVTMTPFIVIGNYHILKSLKELGFKTFEEYWDESYDEIQDYQERTKKVLETLVFIEKEYGTNFKEVLLGQPMKSILKQNYELSKKIWTESHSEYFPNPNWDEICICEDDLSMNVLEFNQTFGRNEGLANLKQ